ncbi:MAG: dimethylarginine dimethylaminohydrolase family protein [Candidatus Nanopelagicales bacterium]
MDYGVTSMVAPLRRVAVRPPSPGSDFERAHWAQPLDIDLLLEQHAAFAGILRGLGCEVLELPALEGLPDSCFVYDPAFVVGNGVIQLRAGKPVRVGEPERLCADLAAADVPVVGALTGNATADGGDMFWMDDATLAVGRSYRTNATAVAQLVELLRPSDVRVEVYDVPHDQGPEWCLHLMSVVSPVREDLAVVYERLAPVAMLEELRRRGVELLSVPEEDWLSLGGNVLAVAPGVVVIASGNDATATALAAAGCEVHVYAASEITKGEGGPTCLTRPVLRRA